MVTKQQLINEAERLLKKKKLRQERAAKAEVAPMTTANASPLAQPKPLTKK